MLINYTNPKAKFLHPIQLDQDFAELCVDNFVGYADTLGITVYFTSGFRMTTKVNGAIVKPASKSNHLVGNAFDANFIINKVNYDSIRMEKQIPAELQRLIDHWKNLGYRWGGDWKNKYAADGKLIKKNRDVVHFDNGLNVFHPALWDAKFEEYHKNLTA